MTTDTETELPTLKFAELEQGKCYTAYSPKGDEILGTLERVTARCEIAYFQKPGAVGCEYEHSGNETEIFYDDMKTATRDGKTLFLCRDGTEWTIDQLTFEEQE